MILFYADMTGAISGESQAGFYPVYDGTLPEFKPGERVDQDKLEWQGDHWLMTYKVVNKTTYSAGDWLEMVGIGAGQQPTLIYLKLQLMAAGKKSDKLTALESYLNGILAAYAADPTPRCDWQLPPVDYQETVAECVELLKA